MATTLTDEELHPSFLAASSRSHYMWPLPIFHPCNVLLPNSDIWNAGSFAPASIRIDLGSVPVFVTRVALEAVMMPAMGKVRHEIRTGLALDAMHSSHWFNGVATHGEWLQVQLIDTTGELRRRSRYLEVVTHESPSWVAWKRIRVWKAVI